MCGIAGYTGPERPGLIERMISDVEPRGPDGQGKYSEGGVHFGHTRLAIIDIEGGEQPMTRADGRYTVCYNGEIYNYDDLRADLEKAGQVFTTTCDTEIIPLGFAVYGEGLFERLNGMFAFALHDSESGRLYLVRDHFGVKPLYWAETGADVVFSSSARAVARHPDVDRSLDTAAIREFLQYRYIRSERHLFQGVRQVPPGSYLTWDGAGTRLNTFWRPARRSGASGVPAETIIARAREMVDDSVRMQLRADVPLGIFLSGGVDSAVVAHAAARHSAEPISAFTFSIGDDADETERAGQLARDHGFQHRVVRLSSDDFGDFPKVIQRMDNPVGDAIVLPTSKLCEIAAQSVKTVLTGEGADELFGGYVHFPVLRRLGRLSVTAPFLSALAPLLRLAPVGLLNRFFDYEASLGRLGRIRVAKLIGALGDTGQLSALAVQVIDDDEIEEGTHLGRPAHRDPRDLSLGALMLDFTRTWLPNQILNKMDQLSMAHGLEARVPYVDHRLYDLLLDADDGLFLRGGENKIVLRAIARQQGLAAAGHAKVAFHLPMERLWERELGQLCDDWLSDSMVKKFGFLRPSYVARCRTDLAAGEFLASKKLVSMASLHMWLEGNGAAG
jgi:asparagine synthase (glutamine-hydrolysing)